MTSIDRNALVATTVSLLLHALALYLLSRQDLLNQSAVAPSQTITVHLYQKPANQPVEAAPVAKTAPPPPAPRMPRPKVEARPLPPIEAPQVAPTIQPEAVVTPPPAPQPAPAPAQSVPLDPSKFPDMASYLNAARERRRLAGTDADRINEEAVAQERARSEEASQRRSPPPSGTNGIFQILSMDERSATFAFRGWKNEFSYSHREVIQVEVAAGEDVERAVVRRMIEIIRRYYNGDFNWDSLRMGRVVVLSARHQDSEGLENFMLREFFGAGGAANR